MRLRDRLQRDVPTLLLAVTACVAVAAHADAPALQGTYANEQQSAKTIESAIEASVAGMNFIKRPIARSRLKKTNTAHRRVEIRIGGSEISVAFDGNKPVQMPADGSTIRWTREDGETFDVNAAWDGERLVQTFKADDGARANVFSVGADGSLNMVVTLTSPQLDQPLVYTLTFARTGA